MSDPKAPAETPVPQAPAPQDKVLSPEARRALAEAEARRAQAEAGARATAPVELGGPKGPEPTRHGDWSFKGIACDF